MIAMSFLYLQGGRLIDVLTAILAGSLGYLVTEILDRKITRTSLSQNSLVH